MSADGLSFARDGAYNLITPTGVFKVLILPEIRTDDDALAIGRFFAANVVHSGADMQSFSQDPFVSSRISMPNVLYKLFFSDQPLQLMCGPAALSFCALLELCGFEARQVLLQGHISAEVKYKNKWVLVDVDFDAVVRDRIKGELLNADELIVALAQNTEQKIEVEPLSGKYWLRSTPLWGFWGTVTWNPQLDHSSRCCDSFLAALKGMKVVMRREITQNNGIASADRPKSPPMRLEPNTDLPIGMRLEPNTALPITIQMERVHIAIGANAELRKLYDRVIAKLDLDRNKELIDRYGSYVGFDGPLKFLDCAYWLYQKGMLALQLGLHRSAPLRLLDLGTGGGHICAISNTLGHEAIGLDVEFDVYRDICEMLDVRRVVAKVERRQPLPDIGGRFDLITALSVVFDGLPGGEFWSKDDWRWFLDHLIKDHLRPGGRIYVVLNAFIDQEGQSRPKEWVGEVFREFGGTAAAGVVQLDLGAPALAEG